jgi:hypothetical protein
MARERGSGILQNNTPPAFASPILSFANHPLPYPTEHRNHCHKPVRRRRSRTTAPPGAAHAGGGRQDLNVIQTVEDCQEHVRKQVVLPVPHRPALAVRAAVALEAAETAGGHSWCGRKILNDPSQ